MVYLGGHEILRRTSTAAEMNAGCLRIYREAVEEIVRRHGAASGRASVPSLLSAAGVNPVLDRVPGGRSAVVHRIEEELRAFRPSARSNALTPSALLRIDLLQQIEVAWWSAEAPFADDAAVQGSSQLVSLSALRRDRRLGFRFKIAPTALPGRARSYAARRLAPGLAPRSSGLSYGLARPAMVGLLNEVAARFAEAVPQWRRGLWVNCIVRSVAGQRRLQELGYSALLPSAHCIGFAADVEMAWLREHGVAEPLQRLLLGYRDEGVLNVIDEGQAWHVCLSPAFVEHYAQAVERGWR